MVDLVHLNAGPAILSLAPDMGGGIARLDIDGLPVLRGWKGDANNPFSLASNILVPFSNRISGGGFDWCDRHHPLAPNLPDEPCPIHGDGFQKVWASCRTGTSARLTLEDGAFGPWRYRAVQDFDLSESRLRLRVTVTNIGPHDLPFGCGFHPWFPRSAATRLSFDAQAVWMENDQFLPTEERKLDAMPGWDFSSPRPLPATWINNGFTGWAGPGRIEQGPEAVSCTITASCNLSTALLYSPGAASDFFCFEPVSHPVNAFHLPGYPGLETLAPNESLSARMTICWDDE